MEEATLPLFTTWPWRLTISYMPLLIPVKESVRLATMAFTLLAATEALMASVQTA